MYVDKHKLAIFEKRYGSPQILKASFQMNPREYDGLLGSQKYGRCHDVTFFIRKDDKWIVNAKHWYPPGLYRIPSGGINPHETVEEGVLREAYEETGTRIRLNDYFLRIYVNFSCDNRSVDWVSHLISADWISGDLRPIDVKEIREVHLADQSEFEGFAGIMLKSNIGGLHYREFLHRKAFEILAGKSLSR